MKRWLVTLALSVLLILNSQTAFAMSPASLDDVGGSDSYISQTTTPDNGSGNLDPGNAIQNGLNRDRAHDLGQELKGNHINPEDYQRGYVAAQPLLKWTSWLIGWGLAILVGTVAFFNLAGLIYVAVPVGFVRNILSGGMYSTSGGSPMQGSMPGMGMGGYGGAGGYGMRGGMMGGMAGGATQQESAGALRHFRIVPSSAIQAVAMADSGTGTGRNAGGMGGYGMQAQQSQAPIRPIPYYLKAQAIDIFLLGVAIIILVLSSIIFDTGLNFGNLTVSILESLLGGL